jgi:hypothetical protein
VARDLLIVGLNPAPRRSRYASGHVPESALPAALGELKRCRRHAVAILDPQPRRGRHRDLEPQVSSRPPQPPRALVGDRGTALAPHLYVHHGRDAIRHLRVAASLIVVSASRRSWAK